MFGKKFHPQRVSFMRPWESTLRDDRIRRAIGVRASVSLSLCVYNANWTSALEEESFGHGYFTSCKRISIQLVSHNEDFDARFLRLYNQPTMRWRSHWLLDIGSRSALFSVWFTDLILSPRWVDQISNEWSTCLFEWLVHWFKHLDRFHTSPEI